MENLLRHAPIGLTLGYTFSGRVTTRPENFGGLSGVFPFFGKSHSRTQITVCGFIGTRISGLIDYN